jgi:tetratricopeptide (TPR) repeat protein
VVAAAAALDDWALVRQTHRPKDDRWRRLLEAAELTPPSAVLLGTTLTDPAAATALLRAASGGHPDDAWVNQTLAKRLGELRPAPREEQVRFYAMARAVRPELAHELAHLLDDMGRADEALAVFADLAARRPSDNRQLTCYALCLSHHGRREADEVLERAESAGRKAARLRPKDARARVSLGNALRAQGKEDEAIAAYREAVRLEPDYARAHCNLGNALAYQQTPAKAIAAFPEAIAELHEAIRLDPDDFSSYLYLSYALGSLGRNVEATAACREAVRVRPESARAHIDLGCSLQSQGKLEEAIAEYREAIRLKPDERIAQCNLGETLADLGRIEVGIAAYCEARRFMTYFGTAQRNLARTLKQKGDFTGSLSEYRKFREMVSNRPPWSDLSRDMLKLAERKAALADRLPGILKGDDRLRDNGERILFAQMCYDTMRYVTAERLYAEALESDPGLVRDRKEVHCYRAAWVAALAAAGRGKDEPSPDDGEKARLRGRALVWLKTELSAWADAVASGPARTRVEAFNAILSWRTNGRLASVREPEAPARLSVAERKEWEGFWARVEVMIKRVGASGNQSLELHDEEEDIR